MKQKILLILNGIHKHYFITWTQGSFLFSSRRLSSVRLSSDFNCKKRLDQNCDPIISLFFLKLIHYTLHDYFII